jgi:adenosine deaminase
LRPDRLGHGVRSAEDPAVLRRVVESGVALEVCPTSNVALGVYSTLDEVPIRTLLAAGADVALGADDPLLFGSRLAGQYAVLRAAQELTDDELATLARMSLRRSCAPDDIRDRALAGVDDWLALPDAAHGPAPPPGPDVDD